MFSQTSKKFYKEASTLKSGSQRGVRNANTSLKSSKEEASTGTAASYGYHWLSLRAALSEKELQLVELREQHNRLISRSNAALENSAEAIKGKDQVIQHLQRALFGRKSTLESQEVLIKELRQKLFQKEQNEKTISKQKELEFTFLEEKNEHHIQQLAQNEEMIARLKDELQKREKYKNQSHYLFNKVDMLRRKVQDLERHLENKDKELEKQQTSSTESRDHVRKREFMVAQLQLAEQKLQSTLTRQEAACEVLEFLKDKLQEAKVETEKGMFELKESLVSFECSQRQSDDYEGGLEVHEICPQEQLPQICNLQKKLHTKEAALMAKLKELDHLQEEKEKINQSYNSLNHEHELLKMENSQLQGSLLNMEKLLVSMPLDNMDNRVVCGEALNAGLSSNTSIVDATSQDQCALMKTPRHLGRQQSEYIIDSERSNTQEILEDECLKPKVTDTAEKNCNATEPGIDVLQEELTRRQQNWKQTEAKMRAQLCQRMSQLREVQDLYPSIKDVRAQPHRCQAEKKQPFM